MLPRINQPEYEDDHGLPITAEVKNAYGNNSTPLYDCMM
jgi:hypothetical protein